MALFPISELGKKSSPTFVRTCVISLSPLREMAHFNKEDHSPRIPALPQSDDNPLISWNLESQLKKSTERVIAASRLHLYQRRLS